MYSAEPRARAEGSESEWFDGLSLVGLSRHFRAVLDQRSLRFEDARGMGTAIELGSIDSLRQTDIQKFSRTWIVIGLALIISSFRVLVEPYSYLAGFSGAFCVLMYVSFRLPILAIDHNSGTRHLISGTQSELLYLYQMLNRVMHGHTVNDARIEIRKSWMRVEENRIATKNLLLENATDPASTLDQGLPHVAKPQYNQMERHTPAEPELEPTGGVFSSIFEEPMIEDKLPFDASFGFTDQEDVGLEWSMFDDPAPAEEYVREAISTEPSIMNSWGVQPTINEPIEQSSSMMIKRAHEEYQGVKKHEFSLPNPTDAAVREECRPGIVKQARARQVMNDVGRGRNLPAANSMFRGPRGKSLIERLLAPSKKEIKGRVRENRAFESETFPSPTMRFFSTQRLRLRADQGHQSEVRLGGASNRSFSDAVGRVALNKIVNNRRLAYTQSRDLPDLEVPRFSEMRPSDYGGQEAGIPGVRHLR